MKFLRTSSEAEMIAMFLRQEYANRERYGVRLDACLAQEDVDARIIHSPSICNQADNDARRRVFARYRGYGTGQASFLTDFPDAGVTWTWMSLTPDELLDSRYIRYTEWSDLSAGTRSPRVAAQRIIAGDDAGSTFLNLAVRLRDGLTFPPLILASADEGSTRVVLEGHTRITAYALAPETIPAGLPALLGTSPAIAQWDEY